MSFLRRAFDFFLFTSLFISLCAVLMVHQTCELFDLKLPENTYLLFVFFATIASYNFHWYLTRDSHAEIKRTTWSQQNKLLHVILFTTGLAGSAITAFYFIEHWVALAIACVLTFLYSAPKIPHPWFRGLKKIAVGKTLFLSFVWVYVTAILPLLLAGQKFTPEEVLFCISRFCLIYAVCIIFDYRDKESDQKEGIRSLVIHLNEKWINVLFYFSVIAFAVFTVLFGVYYDNSLLIVILLAPAMVPLLLFRTAKHNFSDYLYDFVLDGSMALSALVTLFTHI